MLPDDNVSGRGGGAIPLDMWNRLHTTELLKKIVRTISDTLWLEFEQIGLNCSRQFSHRCSSLKLEISTTPPRITKLTPSLLEKMMILLIATRQRSDFGVCVMEFSRQLEAQESGYYD
jgi:hypothetical protein